MGAKLLAVGWRLGGLVLSGLLFMLAMPPRGIHALGWFCMVPALLAVRKTRFAFGFLGGLALLLLAGFLTASGWFYSTKWFEGETGWNYLGFAIFGVAVGGVLSIYSEKKLEEPRIALYLAAAAVLGEGILLLYLPAHLALTQFNNWTVVQLAGIGGIWLVSFLVWLSNLLIAEAIALRDKRLAWTVAGSALLLSTLGLAPISNFLHDQFYRPVDMAALKVGLIQTQAGDLETLSNLNREAGEKGADLAVWPELSALGAASGGQTNLLVDLATEADQPPFVTTFATRDPGGGLPFNTASVFSSAGESERYQKRKPFGAERNEHQAGHKPLIQSVHTRNWGDVRLGFSICFDTCFPSVMNELGRSGDIDLIVCPTLDPMAPHGSIQAIHAAYMPFRSSELGLPIARAELSAWSMMTDNTGRITHLGGTGTEEATVAEVQPFARPRLAKTLGDWWPFVCLAIVAFGLLESYRIGRAEAESKRLS